MSNFTNEEIFKELEGRTLSGFLKELCLKNDFDKFKYIFESDMLEEHFGIRKSEHLSDTLEEIERIILDSDLIKKCCEVDAVEILEYILAYCYGSNAFHLEDLQSQIDDAVSVCCRYGSLKSLDYILNSEKITINGKIEGDYLFMYAFENNHLDVVEYLLNSPKAENIKNESIKSGQLLKNACAYGNLDAIKFVFNAPQLKDKIDIHVNKDDCFRILARQNKEEILNYFIFELELNRTKYIDNYLKVNQRKDIDSMFEARDLQKELNNELKDNKSEKKPKI
jgi:hypothetical protein